MYVNPFALRENSRPPMFYACRAKDGVSNAPSPLTVMPMVVLTCVKCIIIHCDVRMLPSAWLNARTSTTHPVVHIDEVSTWLPKLRTLALGNNAITMTVYLALQSIIGLPSLQTLDLSVNALSGELDDVFDVYHCDGGSLGDCESALRSSRAISLTTLLLAANEIEGTLEAVRLPESLFVLSVSNNQLQGPVPEDYSQLSVFFAGETILYCYITLFRGPSHIFGNYEPLP